MSNKLFIILKKEFRETTKTKAFVISTMLAPIFFLLIFMLPTFLMKKNAEKVRSIYLKDESGLIAPVLQGEIPATLQLKTWNKTNEEAEEAIKKKEIETFVYVPADIMTSYTFNYEAQTITDQQTIMIIQNAISSIIRNKKIVERGIKPEDAKVILKKVAANTIAVSEKGKKSQDAEANFYIAYMLVFLMYLSVLSYAPRMVQSTVEDKNNRVVEVVVSYVKPFDIMAGKILGNAGVGIFQYLIWGTLAATIITVGGPSLMPAFLQQINPMIFVYFIIYFLLGYLIYSIAFSGIGAMFSDMREAGNMMTPFIMLAVLPMVLFAPIAQDPTSTMAVWASQFPFFSSLMLMRIGIIGIGTIPVSQIVISLAIQIITILVELWIVTKIYRIGILSYGKKPTFKEIISWIKAK